LRATGWRVWLVMIVVIQGDPGKSTGYETGRLMLNVYENECPAR
jgi:hypothetical protein